MEKNKNHTIEIVVDRVKLKEESKSRIYSSIEVALKYGEGKVIISINDDENVWMCWEKPSEIHNPNNEHDDSRKDIGKSHLPICINFVFDIFVYVFLIWSGCYYFFLCHN